MAHSADLSTSVPPFLRIPREIRDKIYVLSGKKPPYLRLGGYEWEGYLGPGRSGWHVQFTSGPHYGLPKVGLLWVSRQLRREVLETISEFFPQATVFPRKYKCEKTNLSRAVCRTILGATTVVELNYHKVWEGDPDIKEILTEMSKRVHDEPTRVLRHVELVQIKYMVEGIKETITTPWKELVGNIDCLLGVLKPLLQAMPLLKLVRVRVEILDDQLPAAMKFTNCEYQHTFCETDTERKETERRMEACFGPLVNEVEDTS
ncbi:hypothetical protein NA57DRAFT_54011 [Rhizodiscina lignyota]|uniref:Uncharacterized protein n=1 Tax=Rhizodiscina lignyota TaxID=1504668 RepID=A0A9P4ILE2_9PEZI|nr:hypothetical protein NA57DRAFT_54011 [Rhizodiscina lignyota]